MMGVLIAITKRTMYGSFGDKKTQDIAREL